MPDDDRDMVDPLPLDALAARPPAALTWRERLEGLRARSTRGQLAAGALLCAGAFVAALALLRPTAATPPAELSLPMASTSSAPSGAAPATTAPADVVVHAAGAVAAPGIYRLPSGSRVADLVAAAGGLAADADGDRVNLAALLRDGERVAVPRVGEPAPPLAGGAQGTSPAPAGPVDLNTATADELDALPGIGPATAQAIVDDRARNGPFRSVSDLQRVRGIGPSKLQQLQGLVTV